MICSPEEAYQTVEKFYPRFGINKKNQIARLLFEISKRDSLIPYQILKGIDIPEDFSEVKKKLFKLRYPGISYKEILNRAYLPKLNTDRDPALIMEKKYYPKTVYYERESEGTPVFNNSAREFSDSKFIRIESLKEFVRNAYPDMFEYNTRRDSLFITAEKYDHFKSCPCTEGCINCGYYILNIGFGCPYECEYCYLQGYSNAPGIILNSNIEDFLQIIPEGRIRAGTGEFSDSLALDHISGYAYRIASFIKSNRKKVLFEFKTKSVNIGGVLKAAPSDNIILSWSLNPQSVISSYEHYATTLEERLSAAYEAVMNGLKVSFHFDPVIIYEGWKKDYIKTIELMLSTIPEEHIAWISIGTLRFHRTLKPVIERRFPESRLLLSELITGFDGKLRYPDSYRIRVYKTIGGYLKKYAPKVYTYLCMEKHEVWKAAGLNSHFSWPYSI